MEREPSMSVTLPEELLGRILAMVPFPQIFKARVLSKSWRARLSPASSQDDERERHLTTWFQEQVGEWSSKWKTFYPCFFSPKDVTASDQGSYNWQRMPSLSFLPEHLFTRLSIWRMEGSLLLVRTLLETNCGIVLSSDMHVANILTRSWKRLPPRSDEAFTTLLNTALLIYTKPTYKVIHFENDWGVKDFFIRIYDSTLDAWSSIKVSKSSDLTFNVSCWAHLDGVLYRVVGPNCLRASGLHAFSVKEGTFEILQMCNSIHIPIAGWELRIELVVCNASLLMLLYNTFTVRKNPRADFVIVVKIDLGSRSWMKVAEGPPAALRFGRFYTEAYIQNDCLLFAGEEDGSGFIAYDVKNDQWSRSRGPADSHPIHDFERQSPATRDQGPFYFQPGLNPFYLLQFEFWINSSVSFPRTLGPSTSHVGNASVFTTSMYLPRAE